jgi:uncharacterized protein
MRARPDHALFGRNIGMTQSAFLDRIAAGRTDLVLDLVNAGTSVSLADSQGTALIQWCAYYGDVSALRFLLSKGAHLHQLGTDLGLNAAAFHGHWQLCQFLIEQGAPANGVASATGETPLHACLCSDDRVRYDPVLRVLLAAGADPNASTIAEVETGAFMRDCRTRGETPLHRAAAFGTAETVGLLLNAGALREKRDAHGDTPLSWASWYRRPAEILRLLCYGAHQVHAQYQGLRAHLVGDPLPRNGN